MLSFVKDKCRPVDTDELFNSMLDECYSFESVGGPFAHMLPSKVLEEMDPVAYRCGKNDWVDSERLVEIDGNDYQPGDVDDAQEEFIEELENELGDLQGDLEAIDEHEEEDRDLQEEARLTRDIHELKADIEACKNHQW